MDKNKEMRIWKINQENRHSKTQVAEWANRKEFNKLTTDRNCFGRIIKGIKPELMTDEQYTEFISKLQSRPMVL